MNAPPSWPPIPRSRKSAPLERPEECRNLTRLSASALGAVIHRENPKNPGLSRNNPVIPIPIAKIQAQNPVYPINPLNPDSKNKTSQGPPSPAPHFSLLTFE